jgi:transposase
MGKHYDINFKNKVVDDYFSNEGGVKYLGKKYNISYNTIQDWINKQKKQGNQINDIDNTRGRPKDEKIDYKERYEILKKYQAFLKAQREKK